MPRSNPGAYKVTKVTSKRKKVKKVKIPDAKVPNSAGRTAAATSELQRRLNERKK